MDEDKDYLVRAWTYIILCAQPTLVDGLRFASDLILPNFLLRAIIQCIAIPHNVRHSLSVVIGGCLLYFNVGVEIIWTIGLLTSSYLFIHISYRITQKMSGLLISVFVIAYLLCSEAYALDPKTFQQIRGVQMIAAMKIISVAIELDRGLFKQIINPVEYSGYILCPANCMLGPWISFHSYNNYLKVKFLTTRWIKLIFFHLFLSMFFLILSNCIVPWYIADDITKWLVAYRDAQSFRMSHYFISSLSVVSMVSAGFGLTNDCHLDVQVTKPYLIELPRSLVQVVIFWNIPMHQWLKTYVFKTCQPHGQFFAILATYVMSSLLHGLNFQLSAVLLSIGTFSYVEYNFRLKVASALEVCCLANPCNKQCDHRYKNNSLLAVFTNAVFSIITIVHLAYLGVMFEASFSVQESGYSFLHTISKWENLNYFSHGFVLFMYIIYLMM